jgi:hypothetical protein
VRIFWPGEISRFWGSNVCDPRLQCLGPERDNWVQRGSVLEICNFGPSSTENNAN